QPNQVEVTKMRDSESPAPLDYYLAPVGHSVVISSTQAATVGAMVDERKKIELLTALHTLHGSKGEGAELPITEITKQARGMDRPEIYTNIDNRRIPDERM